MRAFFTAPCSQVQHNGREHHQHQPSKSSPFYTTPASIISSSRYGLLHLTEYTRTSSASAKGVGASSASAVATVSIVGTSLIAHVTQWTRACSASAVKAFPILHNACEHHQHQPVWLFTPHAIHANIISIIRSCCEHCRHQLNASDPV